MVERATDYVCLTSISIALDVAVRVLRIVRQRHPAAKQSIEAEPSMTLLLNSNLLERQPN